MTIEITGAEYEPWYGEVERVVGANRLYRKGTDRGLFADIPEHAEATLIVVNLCYIPRIKVRVCG